MEYPIEYGGLALGGERALTCARSPARSEKPERTKDVFRVGGGAYRQEPGRHIIEVLEHPPRQSVKAAPLEVRRPCVDPVVGFHEFAFMEIGCHRENELARAPRGFRGDHDATRIARTFSRSPSR